MSKTTSWPHTKYSKQDIWVLLQKEKLKKKKHKLIKWLISLIVLDKWILQGNTL